MSTGSLEALLLLLVALAVFLVGAALAEYADTENASRSISVIGQSLMTIAIGAGAAVLILWVSPSISKGLDTVYCWNDHSITHCAMCNR